MDVAGPKTAGFCPKMQHEEAPKEGWGAGRGVSGPKLPLFHPKKGTGVLQGGAGVSPEGSVPKFDFFPQK